MNPPPLHEYPSLVLHTFACDCAQRFLQREEESDVYCDKRLYRAIQWKRAWLEGKVDESEAFELQMYLDMTQPRPISPALERMYVMYSIIRSTMELDALNAAKGASQLTFKFVEAIHGNPNKPLELERVQKEKTWQRKHLQNLVIELFWRPLCQAISYVAKNQETLGTYQDNLEDVLFE